MTESTPSPAFAVQPPFDSESIGDCILRTPDGTHFKVVRVILYLGSVIFRDMFDMPSGTKESNHVDHLPVIPVEEDPETLQALLQVLYPIDPPPINSLSLARKLLTACDKYFVSTTKLRLHLQRILNEDESLAEDPLSCYALSWRLGLEKEAITASRYLHSINISDDAASKVIASQSGSLQALTALWDLRVQREEGLDGILALAMPSRDMACSRHPSARGYTEEYSARKESLRKALRAPNPVCENVETFLGFRAGEGDESCSACDDRRRLRLDENRMKVVEALRDYPQAIKGFSSQANIARQS